MQSHNTWLARAATRIGVNLVVGAVLTAIVGALCIGAAGALMGWILDIRSTPPAWDMGYMGPGLFIGLTLGAWSGLVGAIVFGVAAGGAKPGRFFAPLQLIKPVAAGQFAGTIGAVSSYLLLALVLAQTQSQGFIGTVEDNLELVMFGAPALMICGAIAGALWKRPAQSAQLRETR